HFDPHQPPTESLENSPGGNLGLVDELAAAILREVFSWRNSGSKEHLVLNLSVGWDGELLGQLDKRRVSQLQLDTQLVYKALQYARRSNALVIAAAGNRRGGGESNWPLLPAAWELHRPSVLPFPMGPKPVYAVGGVGWQGLPLSNYRFGGLPRRVALGDHAMAQTVATDKPTAMYTGSSVSAAVVSAVAAEVWHFLPDASAAEVMRLVTRSGKVLPGRGDYYFWKDLWPLSRLVRAPHMRQISLCRAVTQACLTAGGQCPVPNCLPESGAADLSAFVQSTTTDPAPDLKTATLPADCQSASDPTPRFFAVDGQNDPKPCPLYLLPDMVSQRWVAPQPDDPPCPGCSLIPPHSTNGALTLEDIQVPPKGYLLAIDIDQKWLNPPNSIDSAALDVDCYSGHGKFVERTTYAIPMNDLSTAINGNHQLLLSEVGNGVSLAGCTATLNFEVKVMDHGVPRIFSVQSPTYVDPGLPH
ncbi:MAG TPA: S8 family serine peptidase, partial [Thermoanaerobaculia bacterium]